MVVKQCSDFTGGSHTNSWQAINNDNRNPTNLGLGGSTDDEFYITGVQLELGEVATPFEHRDFGDELLKCQRYFQIVSNCFSGDVVSGTTYRIVSQLDPTMRGSVTCTSATQSNASRFDSPATGDMVVQYAQPSGSSEIGGLRFDKEAITTGVALRIQTYTLEAEL